MSDLIRKAELLKAFEGDGGTFHSRDVREIIENEKTVENAVDVIRCHECKFFKRNSEHDETAVCSLKDFVEDRDSYCRHAIRREGDAISRIRIIQKLRMLYCYRDCRLTCDECKIGDLIDIIEQQEALNDKK